MFCYKKYLLMWRVLPKKQKKKKKTVFEKGKRLQWYNAVVQKLPWLSAVSGSIRYHYRFLKQNLLQT